MIIIPIKWLFHWEYTLFSDKPIWIKQPTAFCRAFSTFFLAAGSFDMLWYFSYLFQKFGQHVWSPSYLILRNALELCMCLTLCPMVPFSIIYLENHTKDPQPEFRVTSLDPAALLQLKTRYVLYVWKDVERNTQPDLSLFNYCWYIQLYPN